ncbi:MAG: DNA polymerase III subunit epsilon [Gammaproteobacteria bacterium]|nr:DNA polymerase III subunit epsilon [Gammaproteobacteria bacterium]
MRQIVLDTETTGLDPSAGHRIIEVGCIEMIDRRLTDNSFHQYLNPDREIDAGAQEVHGISLEKLQGQPRFGDIAADLVEYLRGAELIIHNAPFDVGFLDMELERAGLAPLAEVCSVVDTLVMARELHPGQRNNLDALCRRYEVDNSTRQLHGALLDAGILADVYLAMTGGQTSLWAEDRDGEVGASLPEDMSPRRQRHGRVVVASAAELEAHAAMLEAIDDVAADGCLWLAADRVAPPAGD